MPKPRDPLGLSNNDELLMEFDRDFSLQITIDQSDEILRSAATSTFLNRDYKFNNQAKSVAAWNEKWRLLESQKDSKNFEVKNVSESSNRKFAESTLEKQIDGKLANNKQFTKKAKPLRAKITLETILERKLRQL